MRPTPAASTLSEFRWRMWAVCRRWVAPVSAGTAREWRTQDDGLIGGAIWQWKDRGGTLGASPGHLERPLAVVGSRRVKGGGGAGGRMNVARGKNGKRGAEGGSAEGAEG